jgi:hypothetical protein
MGVDLIPPTPDSYTKSDKIVRSFPRLQARSEEGQLAGGFAQYGTELVADVDATVPTHHDPAHPFFGMLIWVVVDWSYQYTNGRSLGDFLGSHFSLHSGDPTQSNQLFEHSSTSSIDDLGGEDPLRPPLVMPNATRYRMPIINSPPCRVQQPTGNTGRRMYHSLVGPPVDPPATPNDYSPGGPTDYSPWPDPSDFDPDSGWPFWYINSFRWGEYELISGPDFDGNCDWQGLHSGLPVPIPRYFNDDGGWTLPINEIKRVHIRFVARDDIWINGAWVELEPYYWWEDAAPAGNVAIGPGRSGVRRRTMPIVGATRRKVSLPMSKAELVALYTAHDFPDPNLAAAVALAESGGVPTAVNDQNDDGSVDSGLLQINSVHGYDPDRLLEPDYNADAGYDVSSGGTDWTPWVTYNSGAYLDFL